MTDPQLEQICAENANHCSNHFCDDKENNGFLLLQCLRISDRLLFQFANCKTCIHLLYSMNILWPYINISSGHS